MGSYAISLYPILKAIKDMGTINPVNDKQAMFVKKYLAFDDLGDIPELQVWTSCEAEELNQRLAGHGYQTRFPPFFSDQFGILSLLEIALQWLQTGESRTIYARNGKQYSGVYLSSKVPDAVVFVDRSRQYPYEIVSWRTKDSLATISISFADRPLLGFALFNYISSIAIDRTIQEYSGVVFPYVSLHCIENMQWLVNMQVGHNSVAQSTQENIIKMDEHGAVAKSATEMVMVAIGAVAPPSIPQPYIIDRPFYLWLRRSGCRLPLIVAYVDYNSWVEKDRDKNG